MAFTLPPLPYDFKALEPHIDAATMEIHHDKHHQAYVTNLNNALSEHTALQSKSVTELLAMLNEIPEGIRNAVRNNGGGHANHAMFWTIMGPNGGAPSGKVAEAINAAFGSFDDLQTKFNAAGAGQFGSGWVFVTLDPKSGKLGLVAKPNQDTPLHDKTPVLFGNDVWEHAYYLKYQNRRPDYLKAWWNTVDWAAVQKRYDAIMGGNVNP